MDYEIKRQRIEQQKEILLQTEGAQYNLDLEHNLMKF
jgi:hypothetical protein